MSATSPAVHAAPHTRAKTNTGISNGLIGIMLFLVNEMALFGSLIFAYLYARRAAPSWPPRGWDHFEWQLPTVNTVVLLGSGVFMHFAYQAFRRQQTGRALTLLVITIIMGVAFLSGQAYEYRNIQPHLAINNTIYGATFFTLTGLHGLHVSIGVIFLLVLLFGMLKGRFKPDSMMAHFITLYWHFVDAVWVVLFALFYLTVR